MLLGLGKKSSQGFLKVKVESVESLLDEEERIAISRLAPLPAAEIVKLANELGTGFPVLKADLKVVKSTDDMMNRLAKRPIAVQIQNLREKLSVLIHCLIIRGTDTLLYRNKKIETFRIKDASEVINRLLNSEDHRSLAHLMNGYPTILKEKVLQQTDTIQLKTRMN